MSRFSIKPYLKATIRNKMVAISIVFGIVIIMIVSKLLFNSYLAETATRETLRDYQPSYDLAVQIKISVKEAHANLGFYVISKNKIYLNEYRQHMQASFELIDKFAQHVSNDKGEVALSHHIKEDIINISNMINRVIDLQDSLINNIPGLKIANTQLEPIGQQIAGIIQTISVEAKNHSVISNENLVLIDSVSFSWARMRAEIRAFLSFRTKQTENSLRTQLDLFKGYIEALIAFNDLDIVVEDGLTSIKEHLPEFDLILNEVIETHSGKNWRKDIIIMEKELNPILIDIDEDLNNLINLYQAKTKSSGEEVLVLLKDNLQDGVVYMVVMMAFGLLILLYLNRVILEPLREAVDTMERISSHGDLEHVLPAEGPDEFSDMGKAFNDFIIKIRGVVDLVISSSKNLVTESDNLSNVTQQSEQRAIQQEQEIQEVSDTFQKLNESMKIVQSNTAAAADAAKSANQYSEHGQKVVGETIQSMEKLSSQVDITHDKIEQLYEMSNKIGEIVKVIRGITDQTNLLALNAAIEAARAGEQGRGFAVVADEVRSLSQDVQKETDMIHGQIVGLQNSVSETLESMVTSKEQAKSSVDTAGKAGNALREIYSSVNIIADMNMSIAEETNGQGAQSEMMLDKLQSIRGIAEESAGSAREVSARGKEFKIMAQQLEDMVQQFLLSKAEEIGSQVEDDIELF